MPDDEELRRFDKRRKPKNKVSNEDWQSATDPDSRIGKMKDDRFHLKYKAENAVDLETEVFVAAEVYHGNVGDTSTIEDTVTTAQTHLHEAGTECEVKEVVADKGYHGEETLDSLQNESGVRTYVPESDRKTNRTWTDKIARRESSYRRNRRNTLGARGRRLPRLRSEPVERSFAHLGDTGGGRRTWLRGLEKVHKRYMTAAMAHNLGCIMRSLIGAGKPRCTAVLAERLCFLYFTIETAVNRLTGFWKIAESHQEENRRDLLATCA